MTQAEAIENQTPKGDAPKDETLLDVRHLKMYFPIKSGVLVQRHVGDVKAVDDVSFAIKRGETLGLVGESGSGKTTVGRAVLHLYRPTAGEVYFDGMDLTNLKGPQLRGVRRRMQVVFQDPYSSLNPRMKVETIVGEPLRVHRMVDNQEEYQARVAETLMLVGLSPKMAQRYPHEFSGGQRQRIGVARALIMQPEFIVADEPVSALDVSIQAQLINLLDDLQQQFNLAYLFIAHDLSVVRHLCDRVAVMYLGKIMETADRDSLYREPLHPYTKALLSAVPIPDPVVEATRERVILTGGIPSPINPPSGCVFHTRCPIATDECKLEVPPFREVKPGHWAACIKI